MGTTPFFFQPNSERTESNRARRRKLEKLVETAALDMPQAHTTKTEAEAASNLIAAIRDAPIAAIQLESLLVLKTNGRLQVRRLSVDEQRIMEANPSLLNDPNSILDVLQTLGNSRYDGAPARLTQSPNRGNASFEATKAQVDT